MSNKTSKSQRTSKKPRVGPSAAEPSESAAESSVGTQRLMEIASRGTQGTFSQMLSRKTVSSGGRSARGARTSSSKTSQTGRRKLKKMSNIPEHASIDLTTPPYESASVNEPMVRIDEPLSEQIIDEPFPEQITAQVDEPSPGQIIAQVDEPFPEQITAQVDEPSPGQTIEQVDKPSPGQTIEQVDEPSPGQITTPLFGERGRLPVEDSPEQIGGYPDPSLLPRSSPLSAQEFNYTMDLLNSKITSMYKLVRFIGDEQQKAAKTLKKLVALDELSEGFWNNAYKEVSKQLLPTILFPTAKEYRQALEKYLDDHAETFIQDIGTNSWFSMFEEKLLPGVKAKCRSRRNDIAASIRTALFATFGEERLERVDNTTPSLKIAQWKASEKTQTAYHQLFTDHVLLTKIGYAVFKQYKGQELPTMHCAYVLAICDILLNPKSSGIKCNDKSVVRRVNAFLRAFESKDPVTPEIMTEIAENEAKEAEEARRKKQRGASIETSIGGSEGATEVRDDDDYDDFVGGLDAQFSV